MNSKAIRTVRLKSFYLVLKYKWLDEMWTGRPV